MKNRQERRSTILKKLKHDISKDKANPDRISKWLKVMESKKRLFALEDEIDKLMSELKKEK
jgi:uncharacterized small protein (DUF1192 family)